MSATIPTIRSQLFFFDGFQLSVESCSIGDVAGHSPRDWIGAVPQPIGEYDLLKLLAGRAHSVVTLLESSSNGISRRFNGYSRQYSSRPDWRSFLNFLSTTMRGVAIRKLNSNTEWIAWVQPEPNVASPN